MHTTRTLHQPARHARRRFLKTVAIGASYVGLGAMGVTRALAANTPVRITSGLLATTHGMSWLGVEADIYRKHGIDASFPVSLEVGGPEAVNGLLRGDWDLPYRYHSHGGELSQRTGRRGTSAQHRGTRIPVHRGAARIQVPI
jgi:hypothetical protein